MNKETSSQQLTSTNVEDYQNKERYSSEIHHIEDTPFTAVKIDEMYNIAIGNQIVTDKKFNTIMDAKCYIEEKPWELLFNGLTIYIEKINELKKLQENEQNDSDIN